MSHSHEMSFEKDAGTSVIDVSPSDMPKVNLLPPLQPTQDLLLKTCKYLFSKGTFAKNAPFKGFLLHGPVGTGKTEIVRQVVRRLGEELNDKCTVRFIAVDSSVIASPKWGESEKAFNRIFGYVETLQNRFKDPKVVLLFDDIESLMLSRGMSAAKEWHYSLNSVFFHKVDSQNPSEIITFATTNRLDLLDSAIKTRLYGLFVPRVSVDLLVSAANELLDTMLTPDQVKEREIVIEEVRKKLDEMENPTIRDTRQLIIVTIIEKGIWSA